jgi:BASS family bile acid:Na+ symporter
MIMFVVGIIVSHNSEKLLSGGLLIILVVILHNLCGLGIGLLVGNILRLPTEKSIAISIEVGMQNSGLASSLAVIHFAAFPLAAIPGAIFSVWHNISGSIMARIYSKKI